YKRQDVFSSSHWTTGSVCDPTEYVFFTIRPEAGYSLDLWKLTWDVSRSSSGPQKGRVSLFKNGILVESSADYTIDTTTTSQVFDFADLNARGSDLLEFRFYGWNATSTGNLRLDNVSAMGRITPVPEPAPIASVTAGSLLMVAIHRRLKARQA
ncbi:MAG: hypothetical protein N3G20_01760, partial [Verrucomicrobiae bacterium]|nr:hypothetical protein [Verrucomicrobiae bacterium]